MPIAEKDLQQIWSNTYIQSYLDETLGLIREVEKNNPLNAVVEIGVCYGGTLRVWEKLVPVGGLVVGVDKNPDVPKRMVGEIQADRKSIGGGISNDWEIVENSGNIYRFKSDREVFVVIGDAAAPETSAIVEHLLRGKMIDFLFHDGIHYGPGPVYDYFNFERLLRTDGLLCIADVDDLSKRIPNLGTQVLFDALPDPKILSVQPWRQGMALWKKQAGFRIDPRRVVENAGLSYYGNGPCGGRSGEVDRFF